MLKSVIQEVARNLKLETPEPGARNEYTFVFDDLLEVNISSFKKDSLILDAPISEPLEDSPETEKLLKKLLQWNLPRLKEYQEVLTWDPDLDQIVLSREVLFSELSEKPILGQLEKFLNNLEFWKSAIVQKKSATISHLPQ